MDNCPIYYSSGTANLVTDPPPSPDIIGCEHSCNCGYIQYENLIPYLSEIKDNLKDDPEKYTQFEFKLREQIIEVSRVFDIDAGVKAGYFTKSHYLSTKVYSTNGTRYLKIPEFVEGTLQVRNTANQIIPEEWYSYKDGYLVYLPCSKHSITGCDTSCSTKKRRKAVEWPEGCYQVTARWGKDCADLAVQRAVREYIIESYRVQDPVIVAATGLPVSRTFRVPHSWSTYVNNLKQKRSLYSRFAIS